MLSAATPRQLKSFDKEGLVEVGLNRHPAIWYYQNTSLTMRYDCDCNLNHFLQLQIMPSANIRVSNKKMMSVQLFICCKMRSNTPTLSLKPVINVAIRWSQFAISLSLNGVKFAIKCSVFLIIEQFTEINHWKSYRLLSTWTDIHI